MLQAANQSRVPEATPVPGYERLPTQLTSLDIASGTENIEIVQQSELMRSDFCSFSIVSILRRKICSWVSLSMNMGALTTGGNEHFSFTRINILCSFFLAAFDLPQGRSYMDELLLPETVEELFNGEKFNGKQALYNFVQNGKGVFSFLDFLVS